MSLAEAFALYDSGAFAQAERLCRARLAADPDDAQALHLLGLLAGKAGREPLALRLLARAFARGRDAAGGALAALLERRGEHPQAAAVSHDLAIRRLTAGRLAEAESLLRHVLDLNSDRATAWADLGLVLVRREDFAAAEQAYQRARALGLDDGRLWAGLASARQGLGHQAEAAAAYRRALVDFPDFANLWNDLGVVLKLLRDADAAALCFHRAMRLAPADSRFRYHLSMALLLSGRLDEAWPLHEARFGIPGFAGNHGCLDSAAPRWRGESASGRTVLLHAEQGFGDTLMFARYVPLVAARVGRVVVECPPVLVRLLRSLAGVAEVVTRERGVPPHDLQASLMSLPAVFGTTLETVPAAVPYLRPPQDGPCPPDAEAFKVGLVWAGRPKFTKDSYGFRTLPANLAENLLDLPGFAFHALQKPEPGAGLSHPRLMDCAPLMGDFADTAALMARMDLVITIDSASAHLAGALGRPTWCLLPYAACWRWLMGRDDNPWYPSMRLYRQSRPGGWEAVMARVRADLSDLRPPRQG